MKVKVNSIDISDYIFDLSGLEQRFTELGAYVLQEIEIKSTYEPDIGDIITVYNDYDISIARCVITSIDYDYEEMENTIVAKDMLTGLQDYHYTDYGFFTDYPYTSTAVIDTAGTVNGGRYSVSELLKYLLNKCCGIAIADINVAGSARTKYNGNYELYNTLEEFIGYRNIVHFPLNRLGLSLNFLAPEKKKTCFDLFNDILIVCGLSLSFYNDKYYIKQRGMYTMPEDDLTYKKSVELLANYDYVGMKNSSDTLISYPVSSGTYDEADKVEFQIFGWFTISATNYPCLNYDIDYIGARYFTYIGTDSTFTSYYITDSDVISSTTDTPTIGHNINDIIKYYLYYMYESYYKGRKLVTITTNLTRWTNTSVDPMSINVDINEMESEIEVLI